jgi:peptidoglycan/LPS O-acetylase OafA/YrhL
MSFMTTHGQRITGSAHRRVFGLDALRAAAILAVVFAHAFVALYPHLGGVLGFFGHGGFYGVELFFVLSGFLIGQILLRTGPAIGNPRTLLLFYVRRWFRTLPLFLLFLAVNVAIEYRLRGYRVFPGEIAQHGLFLRTFASNRLTFFFESWSLAIEEWFYLFFPATLAAGLFLSRKFDRVFVLSAAAFYLFSTIARVLGARIAVHTWDQWQRFVVVDRFDALMIGMFAAWVASRWPNLWLRHARILAFIGTTLLFIIYVSLWRIHDGHLAFGPDSFFARTFRFNFVSFGFALLLPAAASWTRTHENIASLSIRKIALWSYAMYLVHLPVYAVTDRYFFANWRNSVFQALALFVLQIGATVVFSGLLYRFFESRCTRLREPVGRWLMRKHASAS